MVEKYYNERGDVAVLYSPGYGSGWSTWNLDHKAALLFEPVVAKWVIDGKPDADRQRVVEYLETSYPGIFLGSGFERLEVGWLEPGTEFLVLEYDGYEEIRPKTSFHFATA